MATRRPAAAPARRSRKSAPPTKLFVLDTNVLMHDPTSLFRFEEHDIFVPIMTLEELDNNKKGMTEVARNARQASRLLDEIVSGDEERIAEGIPLAAASSELASGHLLLQTEAINGTLPTALPTAKADNQIIAVVMHLSQRHPGRQVILVSKDINMRIKARALGCMRRTTSTTRCWKTPTCSTPARASCRTVSGRSMAATSKSWKENGRTLYRVKGPLCPDLLINEFVFKEAGPKQDKAFHAWVRERNGKTAVLETLIDFSHHKNSVWGITARNREQNFALNLLMNPEVDFVTLLGQAGTGKTLLTLAAGLTQVLETKLYSEIIMTRVTVPVGEDIGFLPGTEEEKMTPWMGALEDNLDVLNKTDDPNGSGEWGRAATLDLIRSRIKVKSLNFMRGRTFLNKFLIIDEAQNLTPKQMKTLITRAGPGTKVVCLGNIAQIDTPYLTEGSSGLTYVVDRFKGWPHSGHVTLQRGERSRLADHAAEVL